MAGKRFLDNPEIQDLIRKVTGKVGSAASGSPEEARQRKILGNLYDPFQGQGRAPAAASTPLGSTPAGAPPGGGMTPAQQAAQQLMQQMQQGQGDVETEVGGGTMERERKRRNLR